MTRGNRDELPDVGHRQKSANGIHLVGNRGGKLAVEAQHLGRAFERVRDHARRHCRADGVQLELESRDDPEITAPAAEAPEEVGVLGSARSAPPPVGRHDFRG